MSRKTLVSETYMYMYATYIYVDTPDINVYVLWKNKHTTHVTHTKGPAAEIQQPTYLENNDKLANNRLCGPMRLRMTLQQLLATPATFLGDQSLVHAEIRDGDKTLRPTVVFSGQVVTNGQRNIGIDGLGKEKNNVAQSVSFLLCFVRIPFHPTKP
jgi:hypothetical protein